jgi:hypothetical protein
MLVTVHDKEGECFHINAEHVSMVTQAHHIEEDGEGELQSVPTPDKYLVFVLGLEVPIILPERSMGQVVEAMAKVGSSTLSYGRN